MHVTTWVNSLLVDVAAKMGMDIRLVAPKAFCAEEQLVKGAASYRANYRCKNHADRRRCRRREGCDFLYTDVWVSMGEAPEAWDERYWL
ncbi:hypothetical protein O9929_06880 [Vibrio lentus]|nr:hypothetical protein [Vibrio lentus]